MPEWAATLGISKQAAYKAIQRCAIPTEDGRVDPEAATALYRSRTRVRVKSAPPPAAPPPPGSASPAASDERISYDEARRRQAVAEALMAEREQLKQAGELVEVAAVRAALARRIVALREALLQVPARLAPVLAAESELKAVEKALQAELHAVLAQVSEWRAS